MKKFFILSLFLLFVLTSHLVFAEVSNTPVTDEVFIPSSVTIENAKILSQEENSLNISFEIKNGEEIQPEVFYGVRLVKETDWNQFLVDEKDFDKPLMLEKNSLNKINIQYIAPTNLKGIHSIYVYTKNNKGFLFNLHKINNITLSKSSENLEIITQSCYISASLDKTEIKYPLVQNIDVDKNEDLTIHCSVFNRTEKTLTVNPHFETRLQGSFDKLIETSGEKPMEITLAPEELKIVSIVLPKALKPQAYNIELSLKNNDISSNKAIIKYTIAGPSATIMNLSVNKNSFEKGNNIIATLTWFNSSSLENKRIEINNESENLTYSLSVLNDKGKSCTDEKIGALSKENSKVDISFTIKSDCKNPKIITNIMSGNGEILDTQEINITSENKSINKNILYLILLILVIIFILYYLHGKKNNDFNSKVIILVFGIIISSGLLFNTAIATPSVTVTKDSTTAIPYNSTDIVRWTSTNSTNCISCVDSNGNNCPNFVQNKQGQFTTNKLTSDTTFTITCIDDNEVTYGTGASYNFYLPGHENGVEYYTNLKYDAAKDEYFSLSWTIKGSGLPDINGQRQQTVLAGNSQPVPYYEFVRAGTQTNNDVKYEGLPIYSFCIQAMGGSGENVKIPSSFCY